MPQETVNMLLRCDNKPPGTFLFCPDISNVYIEINPFIHALNDEQSGIIIDNIYKIADKVNNNCDDNNDNSTYSFYIPVTNKCESPIQLSKNTYMGDIQTLKDSDIIEQEHESPMSELNHFNGLIVSSDRI